MRVLQVIIALVLSVNIFAQEVAQVPSTPTTSSTYRSSTNSSRSSMTVTDGEIIENGSSNSSVNISESNKTYKFKSKFNSSKNAEITSKLKKELNGLKLTEKRGEMIWVKIKKSKIIFECKLTKRSLHIFSNKKELSTEFNTKIKALGKQLNNFISRNTSLDTVINEEDNEISSAKDRLARAKTELEKATKNLERVNKRNN